MRPFAVAVHPSEVRVINGADKPADRVFGFNPDVIQPVSKTGEKVMKSKFIHWTRAMDLKNMFTVASTGRLARAQLAPRTTQSAPPQAH